MMVTASLSPPTDEPPGGVGQDQVGQIGSLLTTLDSKGGVLEDKVDAYLVLTERLRSDDNQNLAQQICQQTSRLARLFCVDIMNENSELSQAALQALGFCVFHQDISKAFSEDDSNTLIKALCNALLKTDDKSTSTRALWCLSKQNFAPTTIKAELHSILCAVEHALVKTQYQSMTVEHESVNVIIKLLEQVPEEMPSFASRWAKLVYPLLVHSAHKIRERSAFAIQQGLPALKAHRAEIISTLIPDLKAALVPEMVKLFAGRQELHVLRIWGYFVTILGKALHKGGSLINCLLGVVEQGFKHPSAQVKKAAFSVWNILIDNFATEPEILYNAKRLKVLMQPLKATSAKTESVAHAKLDTWWHLCQKLGARLTSNFDLVCVPLLEFSLGIQISPDTLKCPSTPSANGSNWPNKQLFGTPKTPQHRNNPASVASPATPCMNLPPGTPGRKNPTFKSVQSRGVEMLIQLLGPSDLDGANKCNITTGPLEHPLISSPTVFIKVAPSLITVVKDVIVLTCQQSLGKDIPGTLLLHLWLSLVAHVRNMVELASKRDSVGVFTDFERCVECLVAAWPSLSAPMIMKILERVSSHIPLKVLGSPSYHSSCAGAMHGTPALNFIRMMFGYHTKQAMSEERFFSVYDKFIQAGMSTPSTILGFAQSVIKIIEDDKVEFDNVESGWRLWNRLANPLLEHVIQSNEVNQGDSLDHDFSAMYACLLYPPARLIQNSMAESTLKTLVKTWTDLYQAFIRCAALVTTAEANQCCEELASRILEDDKKARRETEEEISKNPPCLETSLHICQVMIDGLDFSVLTSNTGADQLTPSKWTKKKVRPLGNLHSVTLLLAQYIDDINAALQKRDAEMKTFLGAFSRVGKQVNMTSPMSYAIGAISHIFTHVSQPGLISSTLSRLANQIAEFYKRLSQRGTSSYVFSETTQQKLEKLWTDILTCIQSRYGGPYDNDFLTTMSPLLEVTLLHPRRSIKDHALVFWNATFATVEGPLVYCDSLKTVFRKFKKASITLPGWIDDAEAESETPISQLIESEASQSIMGPPASVIPNFGAPSPVKMHGSFLKRSVQAGRLVASSSPDRLRGRSPGRFSSPDRGHVQSPGQSKTPKRNQSPNAAAARRKLPVDEDSMQFVTIAPSPTKKRVLTEHQKEVLRSRRTVIPGLYNDLEQSQDTQAFSDMFSQSQMGTESQMGVDLPAGNEPETAMDQDQAIVRPTNETSKPPSGPCVFNLGINKEKTDKSEPSERESNKVSEEELNPGLTEVQELNKGQNEDNSVLEVSEKDQVSDLDKTELGTQNEKPDISSDENMPDKEDGNKEEVKSSENVDKELDEEVDRILESEACDLEEKKDEVNMAIKYEQQTPIKQCESNDLLTSQEVTPPKSSQCTTDQGLIVTPVIKIKKMSVQDILKYSPSVVSDSQFSRLDVDSSPKMFPSSQEKKATRFRRYKSEEMRSSPRLQKQRPSSFDDMVILETQMDDIVSGSPKLDKSVAGKQKGLLTTQTDLAELAERFELDGIEPLDDDTPTEKVVEDDSNAKNNENDSENHQGPKEIVNNDTNKKCEEEAKGQDQSSEESMEFLDSQEELIPEGSMPSVENDTEGSVAETESEYATAEESEDSVFDETLTNVGSKKSKDKPDFILSTLEELTEPNSNGTLEKDKLLENDTDLGESTVKDKDVPKESTNSSKTESQSQVPQSRSKTGRRQRKSRKIDSSSQDESQEEDNEENKKSPDSSQILRSQSKPSGRGRSRKQPSQESNKDAEKQKTGHEKPEKEQTLDVKDKDETNKSQNSQTEPKRRGRGRPRKQPSQESDKEVEKLNEGGGKLKKVQSADGSSADESLCERSEVKDSMSKIGGRRKKSRKIESSSQDESQEEENKKSATADKIKKTNKLRKKRGSSTESKDQSSLDENKETKVSSSLDNSCEDMFGSSSSKESSESKEDENSVSVIEVKTYNRKKRRSFTKLSRKRNHPPPPDWDEDDDVPLAKITHSYLDVDSADDDVVTTSPKKKSEEEDAIKMVTRSSQKSDEVKEHKCKSSKVSLKAKSPESQVAKKALRRALKRSPVNKSRIAHKILSPASKTSTPISPLRVKSGTPVLAKTRSPIATRMRAGKLTPTSARRLLAGKGRASPKKSPPVELEPEDDDKEDDDLDISGVEEGFDDSFDLPLNLYKFINKQGTGQEKSSDESKQTEKAVKDITTPEHIDNIIEMIELTDNAESEKCTQDVQESSTDICELKSTDNTGNKSAEDVQETSTSKPVKVIDPKVGQSLQSLHQRLQFTAINGRSSPTECNTPPKNSSPSIPHKFSPRNSSSPVEFAMRRGTNSGSPIQRASSPSCEIPGVFSPSASPSNGILKRRDSDTPSPSPTNKSRRVSFAEPMTQEKLVQSLSPSTKPLTSSPSRSGSIFAALMPSPLVTTSSRVVSLQSKFITTPSKKANSTSKLKSVSSAERHRRSKNPSLKVLNTRMLFSRGARALMASKQGVKEIDGKKVLKQEKFEKAALDSVTRGIPVALSPSRPVAMATPSPTQSCTQNMPAVLTQGTQNTEVDSTMEVDFESQDAVFPDLVECQVPVDQVLHQLTSSMWVRGLEQLIRARSILTVGHLCSLSPGQVKSLPIRSPKVSTLCQVMEKFKKRQLAKQEKENSTSTVLKQTTIPSESKTSEESCVITDENSTKTTSITDDDVQLRESSSSPNSDIVDSNNEDVEKSSSDQKEIELKIPSDNDKSNNKTMIEDASATPNNESQPFSVLCSSEDNVFKIISPKAKPPVSRITSGKEPSEGLNDDDINSTKRSNTRSTRQSKRKFDQLEEDTEKASSSGQSSPKRKRLVDDLGAIAKELSGDALQNMPADKLFQAHQHVNNLMDSIMAALKTKCRSPSLES